MNKILGIFKALVDEQRIRILMLLDGRELSVCQVMAIIGSSQSLVSRNLSILMRAGFLDERKDGKLKFYRIADGLSYENNAIVGLLRTSIKSDIKIQDDLKTMSDCMAYQKKAGRCDMKTLRDFMRVRETKRTQVHRAPGRGIK